MTSEVDALKTNEFLRRRKLRLQQVREQSKDIARKIRLRTKVEKLRQIVNLETKTEQDHIYNQEKFVKELEKLYTKSVENLGAGHSRASEVNLDSVSKKTDPSRLRGREATTLLRQEKQQKLDARKKSLDRKLKAREAANELSREKSKSVTNQLLQKTSGIKNCDKTNKKESKTGFEDLIPTKDTDNQIKESDQNKKDDTAGTDYTQAVKKNDMASQWTSESFAGVCEPNVPKLILPEDNITGFKEPADVNPQNKSGREKRLDLFALSEDMPSSLQAKTTYAPPLNKEPVKSSLTLISEYLQNRNLRLREPEITKSSKHAEDLQSLKQTILRTRASKTEVSSKVDKNIKPNIPESTTSRKSAVTVYNHSTRDSRNIPGSEDYLVIREETPDEDAYSQAMKESSNVTVKEKENEKKLQNMRNKVAMTKQTIEKEYKDTMAFLNSLPKEKTCRSQKRAFMNENRQEQLNENRQLKMEQEFRRIQNDYKLLEQCCADRRNNNKPNKRKSKPKSSGTTNFAAQDFEYSWMPVPESDASLAIHTIPTTVKEGKSSTVKFSNVDSYHEYRSRHKHTPPTKDTNFEEKGRKRETIILQEDRDDSTDYSTVTSESSSVENLEKQNDTRKDSNCDNSDAERIIIYKIIDSKADKGRKKKKSKLSDNITEVSAKKIHKILKRKDDDKKDYATSAMSVEQLREGVYKTVSEKGDNIASMYFDGENQNSIEDGRIDVSCGCVPTGPPVPMQWDSGDVPARKSWISSKPCKSCGQNTEASVQKRASTHLPTRPSQVASSETSNNSYKTAVVGKTNNKDDFVKLIDMAGQDTGKFYIGATGLLNNEGYEVVIQLRKKDAAKDAKQNGKETIKESFVTSEVDEQAKTNEQNVQATSATVNVSKDINEKRDKVPKTISPLPIDKPKLDDNGSSCSLEINVINYEENGGQNISTVAGDIENNDALKTESIRKTSTSTYTQTTLNTPQQRPVYVHMSSSTSTTYMSPPEIIPPEYLKSQLENQNKILGKTKKNGCKCRKCNARRNYESTEDNVRPSARSDPEKHRFLDTPPNSKTSSDRRIYYESSGDVNKKESSHSSPVLMRRYKGRKPCVRSKDPVLYKKHGNKDSRSAKIHGKSSINPVIQNYVKRLLSLSNEGFKAIEVVNQECSSVATPGSSIINIECNVNKQNTSLVNKISLEQLREVLQKKVYENDAKKTTKVDHKKKPVHKVKSLNISRHLQRKKSSCETKTTKNRKIEKQTSSTKEDSDKRDMSSVKKPKPRSKSSPTPRPVVNVETCPKSSLSDNTSNSTSALEKRANSLHKSHSKAESIKIIHSTNSMSRSSTIPFQNTTDTSSSTYLSYINRHKPRNYNRVKKQKHAQDPMSISTQTGASVDSDINIIKLAESKIQNMEKIADLTEKCTQRIFNLGKVLEEVRKNRLNAYSHITTSDSSETELKSNKTTAVKSTSPSQDIELDRQSKTEEEKSAPETSLHLAKVDEKVEESEGFVSLLEGIPKPGTCLLTPSTPKPMLDKIFIDSKTNRRPPPALSRIHLKHGEDEMVPHELSTVIEVDSPMSVKLKSKSRNGNSITSRKLDQSTENKSEELLEVEQKNYPTSQKTKGLLVNPDLLQSNVKLLKSQSKPKNSSQGSKMEMMDLQKFKEIMLKPFVSIEEFAKQCNVGVLDEGSNVEDIPRDSAVNDDLSSLHSEGSLPDVIGELLKRNIISEPFKFDTASNVNSANVSSDSSLSVLALAKMIRDRKKSSGLAKNKENVAETSDALSNSSNPDLENAFKQLGMGWASSTLKKTKERLALSSSSNTSSSSVSHKYKLKSFENKDDSYDTSKKPLQGRNENKISKTVDQQTSLSNSMIVQEFLNNELAKRITFSKSHRNETETEFVSLYETKLPDQMKNTSNVVREERSIDSVTNTNRARTSTPVQIYKSMTYHSSSSSNNASNGFFSNLDDLSSVKGTSGSMRNHSTSDKDDLTIPNCSLRKRRDLSDLSKSDS